MEEFSGNEFSQRTIRPVAIHLEPHQPMNYQSSVEKGSLS